MDFFCFIFFPIKQNKTGYRKVFFPFALLWNKIQHKFALKFFFNELRAMKKFNQIKISTKRKVGSA